MARYCKSCGSISRTQIPLFIAFNAVFLERSVFLSFCIAQTYIYIIYNYTDRLDTTDHFTPLRACAARGTSPA